MKTNILNKTFTAGLALAISVTYQVSASSTPTASWSAEYDVANGGYVSPASMLTLLKSERVKDADFSPESPCDDLKGVMSHNWEIATRALHVERLGEFHVFGTALSADFLNFGPHIMNVVAGNKTPSFNDYIISCRFVVGLLDAGRSTPLGQAEFSKFKSKLEVTFSIYDQRSMAFREGLFEAARFQDEYPKIRQNTHFVIPVWGPNGEGDIETMNEGRGFFDAHGRATVVTVRGVGTNKAISYDYRTNENAANGWEHDRQHEDSMNISDQSSFFYPHIRKGLMRWAGDDTKKVSTVNELLFKEFHESLRQNTGYGSVLKLEMPTEIKEFLKENKEAIWR